MLARLTAEAEADSRTISSLTRHIIGDYLDRAEAIRARAVTT